MKKFNGRAFYLKDARNTVWGVGFVGFIPLMILLIMMFTGSQIKWDVVTCGLILYSLFLCATAIYAGVLCGRGLKKGRTLAFIPSILLIINFPLGTLFSIGALFKLNKKEFIDELE